MIDISIAEIFLGDTLSNELNTDELEQIMLLMNGLNGILD